jgi:hypothetical protein
VYCVGGGDVAYGRRAFLQWILENGNDVAPARFVAEEPEGSDDNTPREFQMMVRTLARIGAIESTLSDDAGTDRMPQRVRVTSYGRRLLEG